jgi:hypothetical protein
VQQKARCLKPGHVGRLSARIWHQQEHVQERLGGTPAPTCSTTAATGPDACPIRAATSAYCLGHMALGGAKWIGPW